MQDGRADSPCLAKKICSAGRTRTPVRHEAPERLCGYSPAKSHGARRLSGTPPHRWRVYQSSPEARSRSATTDVRHHRRDDGVIRWTLRAPCDRKMGTFSCFRPQVRKQENVPIFLSLRRVVSSRVLGAFPRPHVFFAARERHPIPCPSTVASPASSETSGKPPPAAAPTAAPQAPRPAHRKPATTPMPRVRDAVPAHSRGTSRPQPGARC